MRQKKTIDIPFTIVKIKVNSKARTRKKFLKPRNQRNETINREFIVTSCTFKCNILLPRGQSDKALKFVKAN